MMKEYGSFEEIDYQLRLLSLKRDIARERLTLKRNNLLANFQPAHIREVVQKKVQKSLYFVLASVLLRKLRAAKSS